MQLDDSRRCNSGNYRLLWTCPSLPSQVSFPASLAFCRLLLFKCERGVNQGFLIAPEPSIPAAILRVNASSNHFACRLAKVSLVAQDSFRIAQVLDLHDGAANRGKLAEPNERIGLKTSSTPQPFHLGRAVDVINIPIRAL